VRIALLRRNVHTHFTPHAPLHVDLAPALQDRNRLALHLINTVDGADLQAGFAPGAIVGIDDCDFFGKLLPRSTLRHSGIHLPPRCGNMSKISEMSLVTSVQTAAPKKFYKQRLGRTIRAGSAETKFPQLRMNRNSPIKLRKGLWRMKLRPSPLVL